MTEMKTVYAVKNEDTGEYAAQITIEMAPWQLETYETTTANLKEASFFHTRDEANDFVENKPNQKLVVEKCTAVIREAEHD